MKSQKTVLVLSVLLSLSILWLFGWLMMDQDLQRVQVQGTLKVLKVAEARITDLLEVNRYLEREKKVLKDESDRLSTQLRAESERANGYGRDLFEEVYAEGTCPGIVSVMDPQYIRNILIPFAKRYRGLEPVSTYVVPSVDGTFGDWGHRVFTGRSLIYMGLGDSPVVRAEYEKVEIETGGEHMEVYPGSTVTISWSCIDRLEKE